MLEGGRAQRTVFAARYLRDRDMQREALKTSCRTTTASTATSTSASPANRASETMNVGAASKPLRDGSATASHIST
jgi:hypothetical protein